jgi:hypothetical protein
MMFEQQGTALPLLHINIQRGHMQVVSGRKSTPAETWTAEARRVGIWSAWATFLLELLYVPVLAVGFAAQGNFSDPLQDPYLAILEVLILLMAPVMVTMMIAVHTVAPRESRVFSLAAVIFMAIVASLTSVIHFVLLTVDRQADLANFPAYKEFFSWEWPSVVYALDILAWDWFLGLSLLCAVPVFRGHGRLEKALRYSLTGGGVMCIAGMIGPAVGNIDLRLVGEFGYWFVFPAIALMLAMFFKSVAPDAEESPAVAGGAADHTSAASRFGAVSR